MNTRKEKRPVKLTFFEYKKTEHVAFISADEDDEQAKKKAKAKVDAYEKIYCQKFDTAMVAPSPESGLLLPRTPRELEIEEAREAKEAEDNKQASCHCCVM